MDGYFFICVIVGDHGIRNLRANLRTVVEKAELPKGEKADQSIETKKEMKNSKEDISLLGISQSGKNTREIKKEKRVFQVKKRLHDVDDHRINENIFKNSFFLNGNRLYNQV